ncbi:hypothetical protein ROU88_10900 [Macrococcus capreoli]
MTKYHQYYLIFIFSWIGLMILHQAFCVVFPIFRDETKFTWSKIFVELLMVQTTLQVGLFGILMGKIGIGATDANADLFGLLKIYIVYISINFIFFNAIGLLYITWTNTDNKIYFRLFLLFIIISLFIAYFMAQYDFGYDLSGAPIVDERPLKYASLYFAFTYLMYLIMAVRNYMYLSILFEERHLASNYVPKEGENIDDSIEKNKNRHKNRKKRKKSK